MDIFSPLQIKKIEFANRIVMAPMVSYPITSDDSGTMRSDIVDFYMSRAKSGIGLVISQSLDVSADHGTKGFAAIRSTEHRRPLETIADEYHRNNTRFFTQLAFPKIGSHDKKLLNELSTSEMRQLVEDFTAAARFSKEAGCDGVELHGAHGFFLNMLLSEEHNHRTDVYGGSPENRLRFISELIDQIGRFSDENFIVSYRLGWTESEESDIRIAVELEKTGVELLHVSFGLQPERAFNLPENFPYNETVYAGTQLRKALKIPVTVVNDIQTIRRGNHLIESSLSDLAAYGRPFLADPDFVLNSSDDTDYQPCLQCRNCRWFTDGTRCPAQRKKSRDRLSSRNSHESRSLQEMQRIGHAKS